jgi:hypothetical protein
MQVNLSIPRYPIKKKIEMHNRGRKIKRPKFIRVTAQNTKRMMDDISTSAPLYPVPTVDEFQVLCDRMFDSSETKDLIRKMEKPFTILKAADQLGFHIETLRGWDRKGKLNPFDSGGHRPLSTISNP